MAATTPSEHLSTDNMMEATAEPIITGSLVEQVLTAGFLTIFWLYVNLVNGFIIFVIRTSSSLKENYQYPVLTCYIISDMLLCNINMMVMIPMVIENGNLLPGYCPVVFLLMVAALFTNIWMIGYLAFERYVYFVRPLKYLRYFSRTNIILANIFMYTVSFSVSLVITYTTGRELATSRLPCTASEEHALKANIVPFIVFWFPSGCISIISFIRIRLVTSKHASQVAAQFPNAENMPQHHFNPIFAWKKTVKTVALVSGAFWITAMPGGLIRIGISASGRTLQDGDNRSDIVVFALTRGSFLLVTSVSSILNPIIYLTLQTDLRKALLKYIKK